MEWVYKAVLTGMTVATVLLAARLLGRRVAGVLAGLPVITLPALLWLAHEQGTVFAARSAVGSLVACAIAPWFAAAFLAFSRRWRALPCLAAAAVAAALLVLPLHALEDRPLWLLLGVVLSCRFVALRVARDAVLDAPAAPARPLAGEPWLTATVAAVVSVVVSQLAAVLGPYWAGVLSTLPLISACALVHLSWTAGRRAVHGFVGGYVLGIVAKSVFVYGFATAAPHLGAAGAMLLAGLLGAVCAAALARWQRAGPAAALPPVASR